MSDMPPRKYMWQLADFNNMDTSLIWDDSEENLNGKTEDLKFQQDNPFIATNTEKAMFEQTGPSETEFEI